MNILEKLTNDLKLRQSLLRSDRNIYTYYLKDLDAAELISISYPFVVRGLETQSTLVQIATYMGRRIRQKLNLPEDTLNDIQVGWFVCVSYLECKILKYKLKYTYKNGRRSKYKAYFFTISDWNAIKELWNLIDTTKVDLYPLKQPASSWKSIYNADGMTVIKKGHPNALKEFSPENSKILYNVLNKLQNVPWKINQEIFEVYQYFLANATTPSPFKLHLETDDEKKGSLLIEAEAIKNIAEANLNNPFYHVYNFDFRGRVYANTAFLHEQSSDNAKGLLLFNNGCPLGSTGLFYLKVHICNCFGNDKITLQDRSDFVDEHLDLFISYAEKPTVNLGWIETESPFSFLAGCFELRKIKQWLLEGNLLEDYVCHLPVYIDGSNNGVQHLVALSKDDKVAPLVNLIYQELPGDIYMYIAENVWKKLQEMADALTQEEKDKFWPIINKGIELQSEYDNAPLNTEQKANAHQAVQEWRNQNRSIREKIFPLFWLEINSRKDQRKICKRGVMTLAYGASRYGMGQQIIDDTRDMSEYLKNKEHLHAALLGNLLYDTCHTMLPGAGRLLELFEKLAIRANDKDQFLSYMSPITNFPVVQAYRKPITLRTKLKYGEDELKVQVESWDQVTVNKEAQKTGASPNIIHSFDAAHLTMTVNAANYEMTVVHDSFGTLPGNMGDLFMLVREQFVRFYEENPLENLLTQLDSMDLLPERGNLNINEILYSDYAFC